MGDPITREEWNRLYESMEKGFSGLNARLDLLNGKTQQHTADIAVLMDRSDDAKTARWIDRGVGTLVAGLLGAKEFWFR